MQSIFNSETWEESHCKCNCTLPQSQSTRKAPSPLPSRVHLIRIWVAPKQYIQSILLQNASLINTDWLQDDMQVEILVDYSLVHLVWPNTEELISRPFVGLYKIRLLLRDRKRTKNFRFYLALLQLQLCLQLQQNTMVSVDVDGQICHFCSQGFVSGNKSLWTKVTNLTIHINGNHGVLLKL